MNKILQSITLVGLSTAALHAAWGGSIKNNTPVEEKPVVQEVVAQPTEQTPTQIIKNDDESNSSYSLFDNNTKQRSLTTEERKILVINKLKESKSDTLNVKSKGETIELNIPLFTPTLVQLPGKVTELLYVQNGGLEFIEDPVVNQSDYLKLRSMNPLLLKEEVKLKFLDGTWVSLKFSTSLKTDRYSKISINNITKKDVSATLAKQKYFSKKYTVKDINKREVTKGVNLIVDRLDTDSKKHYLQLEVQEPVNKFIIENEKISIFLKSTVSEPFEVISKYVPNENDITNNKEIVLLNLELTNNSDKFFTMSPNLVKTIFPNYIAFHYDVEKRNLPPASKIPLLVVIEEKIPNIDLKK